MRRILLLVLVSIMCAIKPSTAQQTEESSISKYVLKVYNMSSITIKRTRHQNVGPWNENYTITNTMVSLYQPTFALQIKNKKNNSHEFELTKLILDGSNSKRSSQPSNTETEYRNRITHIEIRYEYMWNLTKSKNNKFNSLLGLGVSPLFSREIRESTGWRQQKYEDKNLGLDFFFIPRITYQISPKILIDLNIPFCLFETRFDMISSYYTWKYPGSTFFMRMGVGVSI